MDQAGSNSIRDQMSNPKLVYAEYDDTTNLLLFYGLDMKCPRECSRMYGNVTCFVFDVSKKKKHCCSDPDCVGFSFSDIVRLYSKCFLRASDKDEIDRGFIHEAYLKLSAPKQFNKLARHLCYC